MFVTVVSGYESEGFLIVTQAQMQFCIKIGLDRNFKHQKRGKWVGAR